MQFDAAIPERDEPGLAEAGDEIPETEGGRTGNERFGFHNALILPEGVGQPRGDQTGKIAGISKPPPCVLRIRHESCDRCKRVYEDEKIPHLPARAARSLREDHAAVHGSLAQEESKRRFA